VSALTNRTQTAQAQAERDAKLVALAAAFSHLPERWRLRCSQPITGDSRTDTLVLAEAGDGSAWYEGVVVDGERDESGAWVLDAEFTILSTDVLPEGELILVQGYNCDVELL